MYRCTSLRVQHMYRDVHARYITIHVHHDRSGDEMEVCVTSAAAFRSSQTV
ncbi:uncharacterized protein PHALS_01022 [Plasmopara halstedii]|uniref:Uncharacterized protein n=1 Tax=Plasmopara halstedii TaxID=4781 RepID=A0A0N7L6M3_PLAHL|nr:uncharacterized protein PHALS_01022 [Plasmopara halstedii]CEG44675.1 hypothetical protein PHALS_01022 [Plasmopara halstedii]|eukprot:XP_024581044.1 hypothetical protein PHALS_01022 [Plasmopara halstedii]